jgi:uncharacterized CHY-type Zn-finger protein
MSCCSRNATQLRLSIHHQTPGITAREQHSTTHLRYIATYLRIPENVVRHPVQAYSRNQRLNVSSKHILNAQVSIRAPCCKQWYDCAECHGEKQSHNLARTVEMHFMCKKCKKAFRKDMSAYEESDEFCPYCDNHYVSMLISTCVYVLRRLHA